MAPLPTSKFGNYVRAVLPNLDFVPMAFITAKSGKNVQVLLNLAQALHKQASRRVSTGDLNRVLRKALEEQAPPLRQNKRPKIFYGTQVATNPPTIALFTNGPSLFDNTYQRYLLKVFRERLRFGDVPIKLYLRHKHREDVTPPDVEEQAAESEKPVGDKPKSSDMDLAGLKFQSDVTPEELDKKSRHYESEVWKNL
jgi:GTP-binding protein